MKAYKEDLLDVTGSGVKGGATSALVATAVGWTIVEKTIFFGLITTGTVVSAPLVAAFGLGGMAIGAGAKAGVVAAKNRKYRNLNY